MTSKTKCKSLLFWKRGGSSEETRLGSPPAIVPYRFKPSTSTKIRQIRPDESFVHKPLNLEREQIRLVRVEDWTRDYELTCSIQVYDRARCPAYEAVSYIWGTDAPSVGLPVNGKIMLTRLNLASFLCVLSNRKLHIRGTDPKITCLPEFLWID